jgi:hypothetical protein
MASSSFFSCEPSPVTTSLCFSEDVSIFDAEDGEAHSIPFYVDLRRAPWRNMCVTVGANLQLTNSTDAPVNVGVTLRLFKGRSTNSADQIEHKTLTTTLLGAGTVPLPVAFATVAPTLLVKVPPGEYTVLLTSQEISVNVAASGWVNVAAVLSQLPL